MLARKLEILHEVAILDVCGFGYLRDLLNNVLVQILNVPVSLLESLLADSHLGHVYGLLCLHLLGA